MKQTTDPVKKLLIPDFIESGRHLEPGKWKYLFREPKFENFPIELKALNQWVGWRAKPEKTADGKIKFRKVPCQIRPYKVIKDENGSWKFDGQAIPTIPETLASFDDIRDAYYNPDISFDGVGFVFTENDPYLFHDIDDCKDLQTVAKLSNLSYLERSVSLGREGFHLILKQDGLKVTGKNIKCKVSPNLKARGLADSIEFYTHGRFATMTGEAYNGVLSPISDNKELVNQILGLFPEEEETTTGGMPVATDWIFNSLEYSLVLKQLKEKSPLGRDFFENGYESKYAERYQHNGSQIDFAFWNFMKDYTTNPAIMYAIALDSALNTPGRKWDRADYIDRMLRKLKIKSDRKKVRSMMNEIKAILNAGKIKAAEPGTGQTADADIKIPDDSIMPQDTPENQSNQINTDEFSQNIIPDPQQTTPAKKPKPIEGNLLSFIHYDEKKGTILPTIENVECLLNFYKIKPRFNMMTYELEYNWPAFERDHESALNKIYSKCQEVSFKIKKDDLGAYLYTISRKNEYNPITEYLVKCKNNYDGEKGRINQLFSTLILDDEDENNLDSEWPLNLFTKWLVQCVAMSQNDEIKRYQARILLILLGGEGIGKTSFVRKLLPEDLSVKYIKTDEELDLKTKDTIIRMAKYWIVELGEIDDALKGAGTQIKSFISRPTDEYRVPYGKTNTKRPRKTVFFGTSNRTEGILNNRTGESRYAIIKIKDVDRDTLNKLIEIPGFIDQLWGEVLQYGSDHANLTRDEVLKLSEVNRENFKAISKIDQKLETHFDWESNPESWNHKLTTVQIAEALGLNGTNGIRPFLKKKGLKESNNKGVRSFKLPKFTANVPWDTRIAYGQTHNNTRK